MLQLLRVLLCKLESLADKSQVQPITKRDRDQVCPFPERCYNSVELATSVCISTRLHAVCVRFKCPMDVFARPQMGPGFSTCTDQESISLPIHSCRWARLKTLRWQKSYMVTARSSRYSKGTSATAKIWGSRVRAQCFLWSLHIRVRGFAKRVTVQWFFIRKIALYRSPSHTYYFMYHTALLSSTVCIVLRKPQFNSLMKWPSTCPTTCNCIPFVGVT